MAEHRWAARLALEVSSLEAGVLLDAVIDGAKQAELDLSNRPFLSVDPIAHCVTCNVPFDVGRTIPCAGQAR